MNDPLHSSLPATPNPYAPPLVLPALADSSSAILPPPARRPRVWPAFVVLPVAFVAVIIAQVIGIVAVVAWYLAQGGTPQGLQAGLLDLVTRPALFIGLGLLSQLAIGGTALIAGWLSPVPLAQRLGLLRPAVDASKIAVMTAGSLVPFTIGIALAYALAEIISPDPSVAAMYSKMTVGWALPFVLFIALAPGFCEELLFRGYVQRRLLERWNLWAAVLVTSLLFAVFHIMPHAVVFAFPVGIWLGLMAAKSGSIWPGVICHASINGLWNVWQLGVKFEVFSANPPLPLLVVLGTVGVGAFAASLWLMFRTNQPPHLTP